LKGERSGKKGNKIEFNFKAKKISEYLGIRQNIYINGTIYYIDTRVGYSRDEAKLECEIRNKVMVRFETEDKWLSVARWFQNSGKQVSN